MPTFVIGDAVIVGLDRARILTAVDFKVQACPHCYKKLKVPKQKGKIRITCPHCGNQFLMQT